VCVCFFLNEKTIFHYNELIMVRSSVYVSVRPYDAFSKYNTRRNTTPQDSILNKSCFFFATYFFKVNVNIILHQHVYVRKLRLSYSYSDFMTMPTTAPRHCLHYCAKISDSA
jgi:hypothetical protein